MSPVPIIPAFDPGKDSRASLRSGPEGIAIQHLTFEACEKAFGHGVVETVANAAHSQSHTELSAAGPEGDCSVLGPVIGMMDYSARVPLGVGHRESCQYELASQAISHRPPNDQTGKHIEHNGQIQGKRPRVTSGDT